MLFPLQIHALIHSDSFPFSCSTCSKGFKNKYKCRQHQRSCNSKATASDKENDSSKQQLVCGSCDATFASQKKLSAHLSAEHPDFKKFLCSFCGKGFRGQKSKIA